MEGRPGRAPQRRPGQARDLAAREGGYVETIENTPVAWTPRDFYLFDFPGNLVGFASPTERKSLVGWFRSALFKPRDFPPGSPTGRSSAPKPAPR